MLLTAIAVSPMLAQEPDTTLKEEQPQTEEAQVDQAIQEATGEVWVDEALPGVEAAAVVAAPLVVEPAPVEDDQEKPKYREVQTLMTGSGGYGAISVGYTMVNDLNALMMGFRGEWIVGHGFGLGIAGVGFTSDFTPIDADYYALSGGYGGLVMEPIILGWFPVHIALPIVLGGGGMASYATNSDPWDYDNIDPTFGEYAVFFVVEVGVELEFNLVRFFRLSMFGNYRWTSTLDMKPMHGLEPGSPYYVSPTALNGFSAGMRFKFGSF